MQYRVLGSLDVGETGEIELGPLKQRTLLVRLLLDRNRVVAVDNLIDALWGGAAPATAVKTVQVYISQLRGRIGPGEIERHPGGYLLRLADDDLDASSFERLVADGRATAAIGNPQLAGALLRRADAMWRGPAFSDTRYADFVAAEARRLDELRVECQEEYLAIDLELGRHTEVLTEVRALVALHPFRERLRGFEMLALYRCGRQVEAAEVYHQYRRALADDLGLEPGPEIAALNGAILRQEVALNPGVADDRVDRIPSPPTRLIGRHAELEELSELLEGRHVRLLTLVGAGGSGKTRLASALAESQRSRFANGVVVVELAILGSGESAVPAITDALRRPGADESDLSEWLSGRELLLIADNAEHLPGLGSILVRLLAHAPRLKVVVTSRAVLHVSGEHVFPVAPLGEQEALELFVARAQALDSRFQATPGTQATMLEICRRLDCLPLAVELAAAQTRALSLDALLDRTRASVGDIGGGLRDLPARQQTLRDTLRWSTDLLEPDIRRTFSRFGVFVGGASLAGAEAVTGGTVEHVAALVDNSLLGRDQAADGDEAHYRMLETVREHALELLGEEADDSQLRHARFFLAFAESIAAELPSPNQPALMQRLRVEDANLRHALQTFVVRNQTAEQLRLCVALWQYWWIRGHVDEGRANLEAALVAAGEQDWGPTRSQALRGAAILADRQQDYARSTQLAGEQRLYAAEIGDAELEAHALNVLASAAVARGDMSDAAAFTREAVGLLSGDDRRRARAFSLINLGNAELNGGDFEACNASSLESARLFRELGDELQAATPLCNAGLANLELREIDEAAKHLRASFELCCRLEHVEYVGNGLDGLAALSAAQHAHEEAALRLGAAAALRQAGGADAEAYEARVHERTAQMVRAALGNDRMEALVQLGASDPWEIVADAFLGSRT